MAQFLVIMTANTVCKVDEDNILLTSRVFHGIYAFNHPTYISATCTRPVCLP